MPQNWKYKSGEAIFGHPMMLQRFLTVPDWQKKTFDAGQVWICGSNMNCGRRKFSAINFSTSSSSCRNRWDGLARSRHHREQFGFISPLCVQTIRVYGTWDLMLYFDEFGMIHVCTRMLQIDTLALTLTLTLTISEQTKWFLQTQRQPVLTGELKENWRDEERAKSSGLPPLEASLPFTNVAFLPFT